MSVAGPVPLTFTPKLAWHFSSAVRARGERYFKNGSVRLLEYSPSEVTAKVRGGELYEVELQVTGKVLDCCCDCAFEGLCKHIWAALLAAERAGHLADAKTVGRVVFDYEDIGDQDLLPLAPTAVTRLPQWRGQLSGITIEQRRSEKMQAWPAGRELIYIFEARAVHELRPLSLLIQARDPKKTGGWSKGKDVRLTRAEIGMLPDTPDRTILSLLAGSKTGVSYWSLSSAHETLQMNFELHAPFTSTILPLLFETGRVFLGQSGSPKSDPMRLEQDGGGAWGFALSIRRNKKENWVLDGELSREEETCKVKDVQLLGLDGTIAVNGRAGHIADPGALPLIRWLRATGAVTAPEADGEALLAAVLQHSNGVPVDAEEPLAYERVSGKPQPWLRISGGERMKAALEFRYGSFVLPRNAESLVYDSERRRLFVRDTEAENEAVQQLIGLGLRAEVSGLWAFSSSHVPRVVTALLGAGWHVDFDNKAFRKATGSRLEVRSGIDWFDLEGQVSFGETAAEMPALLEALRQGQTVVQLEDGSYGMLPPEWLARLGNIARLGAGEDGAIRFRRTQTGLLDALLAADESIGFDEGFARAREQLRSFDGIVAAREPDTFAGQLRDYQREGLGWLQFLNRFGWGGCLADDMGLGKTAQVLALLEHRRLLRTGGPSLVVVPRSLVFNWKAEAARFTPALRIFDYTGAGRTRERLEEYDVVLTTYGTVRRDAPLIRDFEFDYIVLDEAQAIKNAATDSAKAVRLLHGRHRLAVSGTPIENHLGELWSLFEFLNPGMLGGATAFRVASGARRELDEDTRKLLARALRPFILRRTKQQVASELPDKTEQTLWCELTGSERAQYDELRAHYRNTLLGKIDKDGWNKSRMHVLEALLRLRQAACHPGLLDKALQGGSSAKLEMLVEQLSEVIAEGHKALVFSQFTKLLDLVRARCERLGFEYAYLDGGTRDRQTPVERFQTDPKCPLFLISLKAGGLGLNLTAAEYVFLLDPWWNPAVEAQAIDRAHRIGQTRPVFAYRLIARDTVEEKVLALQSSKRELAAALLSGEAAQTLELQREDLEILLS